MRVILHATSCTKQKDTWGRSTTASKKQKKTAWARYYKKTAMQGENRESKSKKVKEREKDRNACCEEKKYSKKSN